MPENFSAASADLDRALGALNRRLASDPPAVRRERAALALNAFTSFDRELKMMLSARWGTLFPVVIDGIPSLVRLDDAMWIENRPRFSSAAREIEAAARDDGATVATWVGAALFAILAFAAMFLSLPLVALIAAFTAAVLAITAAVINVSEKAPVAFALSTGVLVAVTIALLYFTSS